MQVAEEEESELERLKQYGRQMKEQAASRIDELDTLRKNQRDEEKRQREHEHVCFPPPAWPSSSPHSPCSWQYAGETTRGSARVQQY